MRSAAYLLFVAAHLQIISLCGAQRSVGDRCSGQGGRNGVCQLISNCVSAQDDIRRGNRPINCGFQGREPIVCCLASAPRPVVAPRPPSAPRPVVAPRPQTAPRPVVAPIPVTSRVPGETASKWCEEYLNVCPKWLSVAGGEPALPGEFPHMAAIGYGDERAITWNCGGSLISEKFILTAAHCVSSRESGPARWVLLGTISLINTTATDGSNGQIHPIIRRIRHPEYKAPAKYHDIALFEIGPAVTPNPRSLNLTELHPACLSTNRTFPGNKAIASGWGRVGHADEGSSNLLKVRLDIFELSVCQKAYEVEIRSTNQLRRGIVNTMLCAGVLEGKRDTCQGDSGGPLQFPISRECMYEVWGVTSFGKVCAFPNSPSVYSNVFEYISWIEDIVWPA